MHELKRDLKAHGVITVGIVGSGLMGKSLLAQLELLPNFSCSAVSSRRITSVLGAMKDAGIPEDRILVTDDPKEALQGVSEGKIIATTDNSLTWKLPVDCICDCTGNTVEGAVMAREAILHRRHVVSFNVEADVLVGHGLRDLGRENGVVYTGIYGDEPGSILELYEFCDFLGFDVVALGKGKNNALDVYAVPEDLEEEALGKGLSPRMLTSFVDGTNTMIELNAVCNATGFLPDVAGCHGITSDVENLAEFFLPKEEGGLMEHEKVVEFVKGIAPGVFAVVRAKSPVLDYEMRFLKMGKGPLYTIYRPYHLTSMEAPISIAKAVLYKESSIEPLDGPVAETVAVAKRDLKPGDSLEGIGGHAVYGILVSSSFAEEKGGVPIGLCTERAVAVRPVSKGQLLTWEDVSLEDNPLTDMYFSMRGINC